MAHAVVGLRTLCPALDPEMIVFYFFSLKSYSFIFTFKSMTYFVLNFYTAWGLGQGFVFYFFSLYML